MKQLERMKRVSIVFGLAASMLACEGSNRKSPTEPLPSPAPQAPLYTVTGVVSEPTSTGQLPVANASVKLSSQRQSAATDRAGHYRFDGVPAGANSITVVTDEFEPVSRNVTINGDTRLDIEVVRRPTHTLSGVVSEMTPSGLVPVAGVDVAESYHHAAIRTDANGFYSISGYPRGLTVSIGFSREGYQPASSNPTIQSDTRLDVQLTRR